MTTGARTISADKTIKYWTVKVAVENWNGAGILSEDTFVFEETATGLTTDEITLTLERNTVGMDNYGTTAGAFTNEDGLVVTGGRSASGTKTGDHTMEFTVTLWNVTHGGTLSINFNNNSNS